MTTFFWEEYRGALLRQAYQLVRNVPDAQDLVQDTLVRAFVRQEQQYVSGAVLPWLRSILYSIFCNRCSQAKRRGGPAMSLDLLLDKSPHLQSTCFADDPERVLLNGEIAHDLCFAIGGLSPRYRECLLLSDVEGLRYNAIAERLGITLPVVKSRLHRARRQVRAALIAQESGV